MWLTVGPSQLFPILADEAGLGPLGVPQCCSVLPSLREVPAQGQGVTHEAGAMLCGAACPRRRLRG